MPFEPALPVDAAELARWRDALAGRTLWLAASVHPDEVAVIGAAHAALAPFYEGRFYDCSFGFREARGVREAAAEVLRLRDGGLRFGECEAFRCAQTQRTAAREQGKGDG